MSSFPFSTPGAAPPASSTPLQRAYPKLVDLTLQTVQKAFDQICDWIFQLASQAQTLLQGSTIISDVTKLPGGLGLLDAGKQYWDDQLKHMYRWTGTGWQFGPGDDHLSGQILPSAGGASPLAGVWQICDGTAVTVSKGDGTLVTITTPILNGNTFIQGAAAQSAVVAASQSTWGAGAKTDDESAHTHDMNSHVHNTAVSGTTAGAGVAVPVASPGTYGSGGPSPTSTAAGTAHHHTLSNANAPINAPSSANGGLPQNIALVFYMRR